MGLLYIAHFIFYYSSFGCNIQGILAE